MTQPTVSIIVPTFNRAHYLTECLDSLVGQTVPPLEIIVVDDGSEDATREVVSRYGPPVRYIHKENGGKPSAVNMALNECRGDLIWLFDDDDVALPDSIAQRLAVLVREPGAGFVYSSHHYGTDGADGRIVRGRLYTPPRHADADFLFEIMRGCFFSLNSALVRTRLFRSLGGLDPELLSSEDYDFQIRLARVARPVFCYSSSFVVRQHGGARGAAQIRYAAADRSRVFRHYSQAVGRKIRAQVSLGEYLCPPSPGDPDPALRPRALLHRLHVMANHGCIDEFVADLAELLRAAGEGRGLSDEDRRSVGAAFRHGWAYEASAQDWPAFVGLLRPLKGLSSGRGCMGELAWSTVKLGADDRQPLAARFARVRNGLHLALLSML